MKLTKNIYSCLQDHKDMRKVGQMKQKVSICGSSEKFMSDFQFVGQVVRQTNETCLIP